ncbi:zinc-binding dehydrogenase [Microvirga sp. KLBC 81]|uniref:synaptic vesicle VAT-1 family membrane protein n=1 Tax=Microvirga sp. KLBC 81 TaxID=1862707 RepID=UPI000D519E42|nr:medium chain dehydrogenase/reductase family protein [Microvirga sp. KLBC 81]PVE22450.1 zinc-binding dehydrogenase [Microvirga sp. KLBC 81]
MHKVVIHKAGGYEQLRLEARPVPKPGHRQVLIRTRAVGVNYSDICVRWGVYESARRFVGWPITPGFEYSGWVEEAGREVRHLKLGDPVFGVTFFNGYSTHVCVPADLVWPKPQALDFEAAAGFLVSHLTAYHGLLQNVVIRPGMKVLVHSAGGGVGSALIQLCRLHGLHVTGVVGASHKVEYVRQLGANAVIDKSTQPLWDEARRLCPDGYDLAFDANGPETLAQSYAHLKPTGKLLVYGFHTLLPKQGGRIKYLKAALGMLRMPRFSPLSMTSENKGVVAFNLSFLFNRIDLLQAAVNDLTTWVEAGRIQKPSVQSFALTDVAKAHQALESGETTGKLVLRTTPPSPSEMFD